MAYLTATEFRARTPARDLQGLLGDLATTLLQDALLDEVIDEGGTDLEGYATGRYGLPLVTTSQVKNITYTLSYFLLCARKAWNYGEAEQARERALRDKLRDISNRKYHLIGQAAARTADENTSIRATDPSARTTGRRRSLTRQSTEGF
jgi:phage gp36-like protein